MMRCVSYTRVTSSFFEQEINPSAIACQNTQISNFVKEKGWKLGKRYSDRKVDPEEESGFLELKEDGMQRKFDVVVIQSVYRAGKGIPYAEDVLLKIFYPLGIHFVFVAEEFSSMDHSEEEIQAFFKKHKFSAIRRNVSEKNKQSFLDGYFTVHDEKYGYFLSEDLREFSIDEEAAAVIKKIFYLEVEEKRSNKWVAEYLNEKGYESPVQRKARLGKKSVGNKIVGWSANAVKNIVNNRAYTGIGAKEFSGEKFTYELPQIINEELFERLQEIIKGKSSVETEKTIFRNPFALFITDKKTGENILYRCVGKEQKRLFCSRRDSTKKTIKEYIPYEVVMENVVKAIRREQRLAQTVYEKIMEGEAESVNQDVFTKYQRDIRKLFRELEQLEEAYIPFYCMYKNGELADYEYEIQKEAILEGMDAIEKEISALMKSYNEQIKALTEDNPWIIYYKEAIVPDILSATDFRKWAMKIEIEDFEKVHVTMKHEKWKSLLPQDWLDGGNLDGTKE